ncbi:thiol S-methyltransferase TMT1A-like [Pelobates fuscus]|uniref:thiol S-methyltransferase TMT1A-like n=1 Tax=Pelobates fuscus TaxID=191477 RepID=UPI002FE48525
MSLVILILQLALFILVLPIILLNFIGIWDRIVKKIFPFFMAHFTETYNKSMDGIKKDLFSNLSDFENDLKEINLLEIGCGTGANFKFYPNGCKITCLDLNPNFQSFLSKSQAESNHLKFEDFVVASADNMSPVPDASMDVVVCTLLVCSIPNTPKILDEVWRVLKPVSFSFFVPIYLIICFYTSNLQR